MLPVLQNSKAILGKTIRDRRTELGLSQEELAERADLHRTYVGGVERGERNVSLENIVRIARALQIVPSQLLERIE
jgi:transcriptional regulator with XRE-family HTH domain